MPLTKCKCRATPAKVPRCNYCCALQGSMSKGSTLRGLLLFDRTAALLMSSVRTALPPAPASAPPLPLRLRPPRPRLLLPRRPPP